MSGGRDFSVYLQTVRSDATCLRELAKVQGTVEACQSTCPFTRTWCSQWAMELSRSAGEEVVGEASSAFENKYRDNRAVAWDEAKDAAVAEQEEESDGLSSDEE